MCPLNLGLGYKVAAGIITHMLTLSFYQFYSTLDPVYDSLQILGRWDTEANR